MNEGQIITLTDEIVSKHIKNAHVEVVYENKIELVYFLESLVNTAIYTVLLTTTNPDAIADLLKLEIDHVLQTVKENDDGNV